MYISEYHKKQCQASGRVNYAIAMGQLARPDVCELCDRPPNPGTKIVAHHWKGYEGDAIFDVIFICNSCNTTLRGPKYHNGSLTKEQTRRIILNRKSGITRAQSTERVKKARRILSYYFNRYDLDNTQYTIENFT